MKKTISNIATKISLGVAVMVTFAHCSSNNEWKVKGSIDSAADQLVTLEASNNGYWYTLDTISADKNGKFSFTREAAGYPDVYRLTIGDNSIYFPVDSIETVTITGSNGVIDIQGAESADAFMRVDKLVNDAVAKSGVTALNDSTLKRQVGQIILENPAGIVAYYAINKKVGDTPLFNIADKADLRIIGAVANAFNSQRPADPRTTYLRSIYLSNRTSKSQGVTIEASELPFIDIDLLDRDGKSVKLSDIAGNGKVTLISFTALTAEQSPALNLELGKIYSDLSPKGFQIYQIGFDADEFAWRKSAKNLPWTSVYNGASNADILMKYNVGSLPALFILDRQGNLVERVDNMSNLRSLINKYL